MKAYTLFHKTFVKSFLKFFTSFPYSSSTKFSKALPVQYNNTVLSIYYSLNHHQLQDAPAIEMQVWTSV